MATSEITLTKSQELAWRRYYDLTKPKVVALILFTALVGMLLSCLLYTSPSPRDRTRSRMPSSA